MELGHAKRRCVLAALVMEANQPVPVGQLIDRVWGDHPPSTVRNVLYGYVAQLRRGLEALPEDSGRPRLGRQSGGYTLRLRPEAVDLHRFRRTVARARAAADDQRTAAELRQALALWRGPAFRDLSSPWLDGVREALERERRTVLAECHAAELRLGRHAQLLGELEEMSAAHPLDEVLLRNLMTALYRSGQSAVALEHYERTRRMLATELGIDPGPESRELHERILRSDPALRGDPALRRDGPPPAGGTRLVRTPEHTPPVPAQLPHGVRDFAGRGADLARLNRIGHSVGPSEFRSAGSSIVAVVGGPGMGKSALAVRWASDLIDQFPDGQLYLPLNAHDAHRGPMEPGEALPRLLGSLGVPPGDVPRTVDEQAAQYRSLLAARRMIVLLDDAADSAQVRPLLPGSPGCLVVVTARGRLPGLAAHEGAHCLTLDVLPPGDALALLRSVLGAERVAAEPEAALDLARLCGRMPLAMRAAAANLAQAPESAIGEAVAELAQEGPMAARTLFTGQHHVLREAFDLSLRTLSAPARRLFRRMSLVPGPDVDARAAAVLCDVSTHRARWLLDELVERHLVHPRAPGRYELREPLRSYAADRLAAEEDPGRCTAALHRLFDRYLELVVSASRQFGVPGPAPCAPVGDRGDADPPVSVADALRCLEEERANLLAAVHHAARHGPHPLAWGLVDALRGFFRLRPFGTEWRAAAQSGLDAARRAGDRAAETLMETAVAQACVGLGHYEEALDHCSRVLEGAARQGLREAEAAAAVERGFLQWALGSLLEASASLAAAVETARSAGLPLEETRALRGLGLVHYDLGAPRLALRHFDWGLDAARRTGALHCELYLLLHRGRVLHRLGQLDAAYEHLTQALAGGQEYAFSQAEALALAFLGALHADAGRPGAALDQVGRALRRVDASGDPRVASECLSAVARALLTLGHPERAAEHYRRALGAAREVRYRRGVVGAMAGLAGALAASGAAGEAEEHGRRALALARGLRMRLLESDALTALATIKPETLHDRWSRPPGGHPEDLVHCATTLRALLDSLWAREGAPGQPRPA
ncbi:BTAD domain-containing putative transcriptional regulator [Streptomyces boncukensis]|uniref:Transcriptional regulator n=1 Tax=Streptomyces boncukensis TaxID=2711219 RepID=A0A6G4X413_9ACTN|nr:transcriptional regulator [Streptomyces boncukensis]